MSNFWHVRTGTGRRPGLAIFVALAFLGSEGKAQQGRLPDGENRCGTLKLAFTASDTGQPLDSGALCLVKSDERVLAVPSLAGGTTSALRLCLGPPYRINILVWDNNCYEMSYRNIYLSWADAQAEHVFEFKRPVPRRAECDPAQGGISRELAALLQGAALSLSRVKHDGTPRERVVAEAHLQTLCSRESVHCDEAIGPQYGATPGPNRFGVAAAPGPGGRGCASCALSDPSQDEPGLWILGLIPAVWAVLRMRRARAVSRRRP